MTVGNFGVSQNKFSANPCPTVPFLAWTLQHVTSNILEAFKMDDKRMSTDDPE